ncbi:hypothetical protein Ahy_B01g054425 [Arachis hypogaea]|uniref:DUF4283 domain-containing protein n=1 Tax=Arachis hypogaea TaxID=3818 RepID=A0A445ATY4_ARAHY|nr:hypothetical protein Ahy_B01g054425 [Arachis hypogaea]
MESNRVTTSEKHSPQEKDLRLRSIKKAKLNGDEALPDVKSESTKAGNEVNMQVEKITSIDVVMDMLPDNGVLDKASLVSEWGGEDHYIDLTGDFFLVRFMDEGDYRHVLFEGPWQLAYHYLLVQRWKPLF